MLINAQKRQQLKANAHHLQPVVTIGAKGLTDNVILEIDGALTAHELIKVKIVKYAKVFITSKLLFWMVLQKRNLSS